MTTALTAAPAAVGEPYELKSVRRYSLIEVVVIVADGSVAARGKAALTDTAAVLDRG